MIFSSLFSALLQIVFKPWTIIPVIVLILFSGVVINFTDWTLEKPFVDLFVYYGSTPIDNVLGFMLFNYPVEIFLIIVLGFFVSLVSMLAMVCVSRLANNQGFMDAVNETIVDWKTSLGATVVIYFALILIITALIVGSWLSGINDLLAGIFLIIVLIIAFICAVKLIFVIPVLQEEKTKKAFQISWKFTNKHFFSTIALFIIAFILASFGWFVLEEIGVVLGGSLEIIFAIIGEAFATTYFISSITNYFYSK